MIERKYFGTDGIRGHVGASLIKPDFVLKLGWAAGKVLAKNGFDQIIIGKDTRISGYMLESALEAGLVAAGLSAAFTGPMPTPAIAYLTRTFRAAAGIVISASHNPFYDNGIKFFSAAGFKLPDEMEQAIEAQIEQPLVCVKSSQLGKARRITDAAGRYIEFCKATFSNVLKLNSVKIVVDCANGATYHIAPAVLRELGAQVIAIECEPNGLNINENCGATAVKKLQQRVLAEQADVGLAFDGDGDRLIMVNHLGEVVDGDHILYIIAKARLKQKKLVGGVVGTQMSNMGLSLSLQQLNIPFLRAQIGDRYVIEMMQKKGYLLGGENSGHLIMLDKTTTGDGIVAALQVLEAMLLASSSLKALYSDMIVVPQLTKNIAYEHQIDPVTLSTVQKIIKQVEIALANRGRVLIRKSGTEPLIRIMVEGTCEERDLQQYADEIAAVIEKVKSGSK